MRVLNGWILAGNVKGFGIQTGVVCASSVIGRSWLRRSEFPSSANFHGQLDRERMNEQLQIYSEYYHLFVNLVCVACFYNWGASSPSIYWNDCAASDLATAV